MVGALGEPCTTTIFGASKANPIRPGNFAATRGSAVSTGAGGGSEATAADAPRRRDDNRWVTVVHLIELVPLTNWAKRSMRGTNG